MSEEIVETRHIAVKDGGVLEVQMTQAFIDKLRQHFGLFGSQPLEDDHVRMFFWGSLNNAVDKAEAYLNHAQPAANPARVRRPRRRKKDA